MQGKQGALFPMRALHLPPPALEDPVGQLMKNASLKGKPESS